MPARFLFATSAGAGCGAPGARGGRPRRLAETLAVCARPASVVRTRRVRGRRARLERAHPAAHPRRTSGPRLSRRLHGVPGGAGADRRRGALSSHRAVRDPGTRRRPLRGQRRRRGPRVRAGASTRAAARRHALEWRAHRALPRHDQRQRPHDPQRRAAARHNPKLVAYIYIDSPVAATLARALVPTFGFLADRKLGEGMRVTAEVAEWAIEPSGGFCA